MSESLTPRSTPSLDPVRSCSTSSPRRSGWMLLVALLAVAGLGVTPACDDGNGGGGGSTSPDDNLFASAAEPWVGVNDGQRDPNDTMVLEETMAADGSFTFTIAYTSTQPVATAGNGNDQVSYRGRTYTSMTASGNVESGEIFTDSTGDWTMRFNAGNVGSERQTFSDGRYWEVPFTWSAGTGSVTIEEITPGTGSATATSIDYTASSSSPNIRADFVIDSNMNPSQMSFFGTTFEPDGGGQPMSLASGQTWVDTDASDGIVARLSVQANNIVVLSLTSEIDLSSFGVPGLTGTEDLGGAVYTFRYMDTSSGGASGVLELAGDIDGATYEVTGSGTAQVPYELSIWDLSGRNTRYLKPFEFSFFNPITMQNQSFVFVSVVVSEDILPDDTDVYVFQGNSTTLVGTTWTSVLRGAASYTSAGLTFNANGTFSVTDGGQTLGSGYWQADADRTWYAEPQRWERP